MWIQAGEHASGPGVAVESQTEISGCDARIVQGVLDAFDCVGRCKRVGVDPAKFFAGIAEQAIKDQLKANTDEVMARGGFGSPTIFIDKTDMYFGNDRLPLVREALARRKERAA